jgi:uncharacterized protein YycO
MKIGDIVLARSHTPAGVIIRTYSKGSWNHCAMYVGNDKVIETTEQTGVTITSVQEFCSRYDQVSYLDGPKDISIDYQKYKDIPFPTSLQLLASCRRSTLDGPLCCSQLVSKILTDNGYDVNVFLPQDFVSMYPMAGTIYVKIPDGLTILIIPLVLVLFFVTCMSSTL